MRKGLIALTLCLFVGCLVLGFNLAHDKPLWNDEVYSQKISVQSLSFLQIFLGKVPEGNNTPLFYTLQKIISEVFHVKIPKYIEIGEWEDARGQIILRVPAIVCMSASIVFIFYFFAKHCSWMTGLYATMLALSSLTVWAYWAEARHYALWFLLTLLQSFVFLKIFWNKGTTKNLWRKLTVINVLLSMTVVFGAVQIAVSSAFLWFFHRKDWKSYIFPTAIPLCLSVFYYMTAPRYQFHLPPHVNDLFLLNIPLDQWIIIGCGILFFLIARLKQEIYIAYLIVMTILAAVLLLTMNSGTEGFEFTYRYFIFLTPLGIIATVSALQRLLDWAQKDVWLKTNLLIGVGGLLIWRFFNSIILILGLF